MTFTVPADAYDRFMGRYARGLAPQLADAAGVTAGRRVLDVGCGPGALTAELARRVGEERVAAIDPAPQFAAACRERHPKADVRDGAAEELPWADGTFDATLSCLVIGFMTDPDAGVREMARVTTAGGAVAACMWDLAGDGMTMLRVFWDAARRVDPGTPGERRLAGAAEGDIAARFARAGLRDVEAGSLTATVAYTGFDDFWEPFTFGVGPAGGFLRSRSPDEQEQIRAACRETLPDGPFELPARAWSASGTVAG